MPQELDYNDGNRKTETTREKIKKEKFINGILTFIR